MTDGMVTIALAASILLAFALAPALGRWVRNRVRKELTKGAGHAPSLGTVERFPIWERSGSPSAVTGRSLTRRTGRQ